MCKVGLLVIPPWWALVVWAWAQCPPAPAHAWPHGVKPGPWGQAREQVCLTSAKQGVPWAHQAAPPQPPPKQPPWLGSVRRQPQVTVKVPSHSASEGLGHAKDGRWGRGVKGQAAPACAAACTAAHALQQGPQALLHLCAGPLLSQWRAALPHQLQRTAALPLHSAPAHLQPSLRLPAPVAAEGEQQLPPLQPCAQVQVRAPPCPVPEPQPPLPASIPASWQQNCRRHWPVGGSKGLPWGRVCSPSAH
jgi:hypothetical protein